MKVIYTLLNVLGFFVPNNRFCWRAHVLFGVQHRLCCVFGLFVFVTMLPASMYCPFFIDSSVFSNVYLSNIFSVTKQMIRSRMVIREDMFYE
jgi:hypothetical protein